VGAQDAERARRLYQRLAAIYDRRWEKYIDVSLSRVLGAAGFLGEEHVQDVPCGTGELAVRLVKRWPHLDIVGVDLSTEMLDRAKSKPLEGRVEWVEADARSMPFDDRSFDAAICANGFHYFPEPDAYLNEFRRVIRPGGKLFLLDWCDDYLLCKLCSRCLYWTNAALRKVYTLRECEQRLDRAGFTVIAREQFRIDWLWGMMHFVSERRRPL
jgi:ubiquinone/menaquinone biosynthesis C-methylase UbiE